ncbi:hypothetical protein UPYG_G00219960 [Umbra pygmaea]|uniref:Cation channel sperm-associated protein subunit beta C-terminal domain-containing protein n=1 Tax=Umbra pygmaea TaxID=75934 RepID=A0ABD0WBI7_UMBPY
MRLRFPVTYFNIYLFLRRPKHPDVPLRSPYFVTVKEVNNRTTWMVTGTKSTPTLERVRMYFKGHLNLYNPERLLIGVYGTELYHFRISVIPGVVLCDLSEEVQLYVVDPPLSIPGQLITSSATAIILGVLVFLGFFLHHNGIVVRIKNHIRAFFSRHQATVSPGNTMGSTSE